MSKFCFSVNNAESRQEGVIESHSFVAAVDALGLHVDVQRGDVLEIGVLGFRPRDISVLERSAVDFRCGSPRVSRPPSRPAGAPFPPRWSSRSSHSSC